MKTPEEVARKIVGEWGLIGSTGSIDWEDRFENHLKETIEQARREGAEAATLIVPTPAAETDYQAMVEVKQMAEARVAELEKLVYVAVDPMTLPDDMLAVFNKGNRALFPAMEKDDG